MYTFTDSTTLNIASTIAEVMFQSNVLLQTTVAVFFLLLEAISVSESHCFKQVSYILICI